jgi:hypothetical protein
MTFDPPFTLGPFEVDSEGRLSPIEHQASPAFLFRWRDRVVRSHLALTDATTGRLSMQTVVGRIPSTAVTPDETLRPRSFALLHWLSNGVPKDWQMRLSPDHRVSLTTEVPVELPITAVALVTRITCFALALAPYLDLLDEAGVTTRAA